MTSRAPADFAKLSAETYIAERLKQYQGWYDAKAVRCKRQYLQMRGASVVAAAIVPVLVNTSFEARDVVATVLSLIVVVLVSLESVLHYREQWKNYRSTEQYLGREEMMFRSGVGPYAGLDNEEARRLLVERAEEAIASENAATLNTMTLAGEATHTENS
jgi:hypothetical protein